MTVFSTFPTYQGLSLQFVQIARKFVLKISTCHTVIPAQKICDCWSTVKGKVQIDKAVFEHNMVWSLSFQYGLFTFDFVCLFTHIDVNKLKIPRSIDSSPWITFKILLVRGFDYANLQLPYIIKRMAFLSVILTVADPGFPRGRGANIRFFQIFSKNAWNWKNLDPKGVREPHTPFRSATD